MKNVLPILPCELKPRHEIQPNRKEKAFISSLTVIALVPPRTLAKEAAQFWTPRPAIDVRFYSPGSTVYCCVWLAISHRKTGFRYDMARGGRASGYGYDKFSSAYADAMQAMRSNVDDVAGRGLSAIYDHLHAMMAELGYTRKQYVIHHAHG